MLLSVKMGCLSCAISAMLSLSVVDDWMSNDHEIIPCLIDTDDAQLCLNYRPLRYTMRAIYTKF